MSILRNFTALIAREPVVVVAGVLTSGVGWLGTYVFTGFNPSTHAQEITGAATAVAVAGSWIARQFTTPAGTSSAPQVAFLDHTAAAHTPAPVDTTPDEPPPFPGGAPADPATDPAPPAAIGA